MRGSGTDVCVPKVIRMTCFLSDMAFPKFPCAILAYGWHAFVGTMMLHCFFFRCFSLWFVFLLLSVLFKPAPHYTTLCPLLYCLCPQGAHPCLWWFFFFLHNVPLNIFRRLIFMISLLSAINGSLPRRSITTTGSIFSPPSPHPHPCYCARNQDVQVQKCLWWFDFRYH